MDREGGSFIFHNVTFVFHRLFSGLCDTWPSRELFVDFIDYL